MKYTVTSQDRPQNSPMYSLNTGLDSFIMFNEETLGEQVTLTGLMADREDEANTTELSKQFAEPLSISKLNKGLKLQVMHPLLLNIENQESGPQPNNISEEMKQIQLSVDTQEQSESTVVEEDVHQTDEIETIPLWSMYFDGSYTRTNAGAGVWISNTENNHTESISINKPLSPFLHKPSVT